MVRFIVAGAGIGGLSAAIALARQGCPVTVLERRASITEIGAGLQLSPNATRHLAEWGVLDAVRQSGAEPDAIRIRRGLDGVELALMPLTRAGRSVAPFLLLHRADLQSILADAALTSSQVNVRMDVGVDQVVASTNRVTVSARTAMGTECLAADGFVGAAGLRDPIATETSAPRFSGRVAWRALVPADAVPSELRRTESNLWLGPSAHLVHYPIRRGSVVNLVAIVEASGPGDLGGGDLWAEVGNRNVLLDAFKSWHALPRLLIEAAPTWRTWPLFDRPPGLAWSRDRCTLLGDAAHPMLPFLAQGASQAIEDAAVLAEAIATCPLDVAQAFRRYESMRRPRAERVQQASRIQGRIYHLGGAAALARDTVMKLMGSRRMLRRMDWLYQPA